jgi:hypothetical protein
MLASPHRHGHRGHQTHPKILKEEKKGKKRKRKRKESEKSALLTLAFVPGAYDSILWLVHIGVNTVVAKHGG